MSEGKGPKLMARQAENGLYCNIFMVSYILNINIQVTNLGTVSFEVYNAEVCGEFFKFLRSHTYKYYEFGHCPILHNFFHSGHQAQFQVVLTQKLEILSRY